MQLQTFVGPTVADAMNQVRMAIGDDAIILATRDHPNGGMAVTVAVEKAAGAPKPPGPAAPVAEPSPPLAETQEEIEADEPYDRFSFPTERQSEPEVPALNGGGPSQATAPEPIPFPRQPRHPAPATGSTVADSLYDAFRAHGLPAAIGGGLMDLAVEFETSDPVAALAAALERRFVFAPVDVTRAVSPVMAVGPAGSGKTQTIGKLAARAAMSGKTVTLINLDTERTGRGAPISGFASTLGCVLAEASNARELNQALASAVASDLVLIDAPGVNHLDPAEMEMMRNCLIDGLVEPLLVVPAGIDPVEAADLAGSFHEIGARRAVITRLDAVRRLGGALAIAHEQLLALAHFGTAQRVKDGLVDAHPVALARALVPNGATPTDSAEKSRDERTPA